MERRRLALAGTLAAVALAYLPALPAPLLWDDTRTVIVHDWNHAGAAAIANRPIVDLSFAIQLAAGAGPLALRAFNLGLHLLAVGLLFAIVSRSSSVIASRGKLPKALADRPLLLPALAALLWGLHPICTEAVAYIAQRSEPAAAAFSFAAILALIHKRHALAALAVAGAMLSKESAATLPAILLVIGAALEGGTLAATLRRSPKFYAALALILAARVALSWPHLFSTGAEVSAGFGTAAVGPMEYLATQAGAVVPHYLRLAVWPAPLILDYAWPITAGFTLAAGTLAAAILGAAVARRRFPLSAGLILCAALALAVSSGVIPLKDAAAAHRAYLSLAPLAVIAACVCIRAFDTHAAVVGLSLAIMLAALTVTRSRQYDDPAQLWAQAVESNPENARAYCNLGKTLHLNGQPADAIIFYLQAAHIDPHKALYRYNLGVAFADIGNAVEARKHYIAAAELDPHIRPLIARGLTQL